MLRLGNDIAMSNDTERKAITLVISGDMANGEALSPQADIAIIGKYLTEAALLVRGEAKDGVITLENGIEHGSLALTLLTSLSLYNSFWTDMANIQDGNYLGVSPKRVKVIQEWDKDAEKSGRCYNIGTKAMPSMLTLSKEKRLPRPKDVYVTCEKIIEGMVIDAGGKDNPNIHLSTKREGTLKIAASREQLSEGENPLYKTLGVKVKYKLNLRTNQKGDYELVNYIIPPAWDESKLDAICQQGRKDWAGVDDPAAWVSELRGTAK